MKMKLTMTLGDVAKRLSLPRKPGASAGDQGEKGKHKPPAGIKALFVEEVAGKALYWWGELPRGGRPPSPHSLWNQGKLAIVLRGAGVENPLRTAAPGGLGAEGWVMETVGSRFPMGQEASVEDGADGADKDVLQRAAAHEMTSSKSPISPTGFYSAWINNPLRLVVDYAGGKQGSGLLSGATPLVLILAAVTIVALIFVRG